MGTIPRLQRAVFTFEEAGCWLLPPQSPALTALLPPPALGECRHHSLARRLVAVCWRAILMIAKGQSPHPRHANWHSGRASMIRPTTTPSQSTSKRSSFPSPDGREADGALEDPKRSYGRTLDADFFL
jgi:hypothetical protein